MLSLLLTLTLATSHAQPRDELPQQQGEDIAAWRTTQQQCADSAPEQCAEGLTSFILAYSASPLAERAYGQLVESGVEQPELPALTLTRLRSSYDAHQAALARQATSVVVVNISMSEPSAVAPVMLPPMGRRSLVRARSRR